MKIIAALYLHLSVTIVQAVAQGSSQDVTLPEGYVWYETMIVLRPDMSEEER